MPLFKPDVQKVLRSVGIDTAAPTDLKDQLSAAGLDLPSVLNTVSHIMDHGDTDSNRLRAAETILKVNGLLKEQAAPPPSVTIIIRDSQSLEVNPILVPRKQKEETVQ